MNLKYCSTLIVALVFTIGLIGCKSPNSTTNASGSDLKLKLKAGETYLLHMTSEQDIAQQIPQQPELKFHQTLQIGLSGLVTSIDADGNYNLDVTYKSFACKITGLPEPVEFDSTSSNHNDFPLANIVNKTYQIKITPLGKVLDVKGADQLIDVMVDSMTSPPEVKAILSKEALKNQFGDKATQEMMSGLFGSFPDRPIKEGERWQQELTMKYSYPAKLDIDYTLIKATNSNAQLDVKTSRKPLEDAPTMNVGNMTFSYQLNGEDSGSIDVNLKTGWINSSNMHSKMTGKVVVAPNQDLPEGLSWPISIDSTVSLKGEGPVAQ